MESPGAMERRRSSLLSSLRFRWVACILFAMLGSTASGQSQSPAGSQSANRLIRLPTTELEPIHQPAAAFAEHRQVSLDESLSRRIQALESAYQRQMASDAQAATAPTTPSKPTLRVTGRVNMDTWFFPGDSPGVNAFETGDANDSPQDRWAFRRLRFGVDGDILENVHYKIEMEFAGANRTEYRDAYLGFTELPVLQTVLIGNQKRPYGLDYLNSAKYNVFIERPFVIEGFNPVVRRLGVCSYGVSEDEAWNWRYGVFNRESTSNDAGYIGDHYQAEVAGRMANTLWYDECSGGRGYAHWAIAGSYGHPDGTPSPGAAANTAQFNTRPEARTSSNWLNTQAIAGADGCELLGLEGVVNVGALQIVGEYQNLWTEREAGFGSDLHFHGGYLYAAYFLTGEHTPWERRTGTLSRVRPFENFFLVNTCDSGVQGGWGAWQVAVRYSYADFSDGDVLGGVGEAVTLGVNWWWNPYARMQFNYLNGRISDHYVVDGQTAGSYQIIGASFMVDF